MRGVVLTPLALALRRLCHLPAQFLVLALAMSDFWPSESDPDLQLR
jgi:hypothetical protein